MTELNNGSRPFWPSNHSRCKNLETTQRTEDAFYAEIALVGYAWDYGPGTNRVNKYTLGKASQG